MKIRINKGCETNPMWGFEFVIIVLALLLNSYGYLETTIMKGVIIFSVVLLVIDTLYNLFPIEFVKDRPPTSVNST